MLPISVNQLIPFTPKDREGDVSAPVYFLRVPTIPIRAAISRDLVANEARLIAGEAHERLLYEAIDVAVEDHQRAEIRSLLDDIVAAMKEGSATDVHLQQLDDIESQLMEVYPPLQNAKACNLYFFQMHHYLTAKYCLAGWENVSADFKKQGLGVSDESLSSIPDGHVYAIGMKASSLLNINKEQEKNLPSPLRSASSQSPSTAEANHPTAATGSSSDTGLSKTLN